MDALSPGTPGQEVEMADDQSAAERRQQARQASASGQHAGEQASETSRESWARQLMRPEWLIDLPHNLATDWYVLPRPEGQRCLLIASGGQTVARMRSGVVMSRFPSALPGGSRHTQMSSDAYCILDTIFHPPTDTYYVLDMMCWKGYALYDCSAEFRLFWVAGKLAETDAARPGSCYNKFAIVGVPAFHADPGGLTAAHAGPVAFVRDGLYFLHREGHYRAGQSPLALVWKDAACSRYLLDTDLNGNVPQLQHVVLEYGEGGVLQTGDEEPVTLARLALNSPLLGALPAPPTRGKLLRFAIGPGGMQLVDGHPVAVDLQYEGGAHARRGRADPCSKILFQYLARRQPVSLQLLLQASAASAQAQQQQQLGGGMQNQS